jgi:hypothetical protein
MKMPQSSADCGGYGRFCLISNHYRERCRISGNITDDWWPWAQLQTYCDRGDRARQNGRASDD